MILERSPDPPVVDLVQGALCPLERQPDPVDGLGQLFAKVRVPEPGEDRVRLGRSWQLLHGRVEGRPLARQIGRHPGSPQVGLLGEITENDGFSVLGRDAIVAGPSLCRC